MYHIVDSAKTFDDACAALEAAVKRHNFGVLHIHDLGNTLRGKGFAFPEQCRVFEVCNPAQASKVLATDMKLNMALPCRISVYTEGGQTRIGMIRPEPLLSVLSQDATLAQVASEVEASIKLMMAEAA